MYSQARFDRIVEKAVYNEYININEVQTMDTTEKSVIEMINSTSDPELALEIAIKLALKLLELIPTVQCTASSSLPA